MTSMFLFFFFQAEDGIRDIGVTGVQTCALPIYNINNTIEFISIYDILRLHRKEATAMGTLRFADLQTRSTEVLDLTSLTIDEFQQLVPPFETAFQAHMAAWRLDGQPRPARGSEEHTAELQS